MNSAELLEAGRRVLRIEGEALMSLEAKLDDNFVEAIRLLAGLRGRAIVSGLGKSGIVARKIAATLTSTGTPAFFMHAVEGVHGDLGMVLRDDLLLAISKSGESNELQGLLTVVKSFGVPTICMTASVDSTLATHSDVVLEVAVKEEACPHDLAPTSSTTAMLAMGDALAVAVLLQKGFGPEDFARLHPGGTLGRKLLRVDDVMLTDGDQVPSLPPTAPLRDVMIAVAHKRGTVPIVDEERRVVGVITAGDLTRFMEDHEEPLATPAHEAMNKDPKIIAPDVLAAEAIYDMERFGIMALPVCDESRHLIGIVHLHDLMRARGA